MSTTAGAALFDSSGQRIVLGRSIARGGEGAVYELVGRSDVVAKVYHEAPSADRAQKLGAMPHLRNDRIERLAAWPLDILREAPSATPIGFLMPKVADRKDIHNLYGPKSRKSEFPRADWRFLVRTAANVARAFHVVHDIGAVIGDVNHSGILVGQDATVRLIDCDSFQIALGTKRYECEVGTPDFTPPELQSRPFKGIIRTTNHDAFGLGVLIFQLLFMGRHPFVGRFSGSGEMPIERAITEYRFAYGPNASGRQMAPPPFTPPLTIVGPEITALFEQAFGRSQVRPDAKTWADRLTGFESTLRQCSAVGSHWHAPGTNCPWCPMEAAIGFDLFPFVYSATSTSTFNLDEFLQRVSSIYQLTPPPALPSTPSLEIKPSPEAVIARRKVIKDGGTWKTFSLLSGVGGLVAAAQIGSGGVAFAGIVLALWLWFRDSGVQTHQRAPFQAAYDEAKKKFDDLERTWKDRSITPEFYQLRSEIERKASDWRRIPHERVHALTELKRKQKDLQLDAFLDQFKLDRADILHIRDGRKRILQSYGIETAADITDDNLRSVPGFGDFLTSVLKTWRREKERRFTFNPNQILDPRYEQKIDKDLALKRSGIEKDLERLAAELRLKKAQIEKFRTGFYPNLLLAQRELAQAEANLNSVGAQG